jgi:hypothetical protein
VIRSDGTVFGLFLDLDLLAPDLLLDDLGVLDDVLADVDLLLDHRALLDHHLFLYNGDDYLVLTDLRPEALPLRRRSLPFDGDALYRHLHALLGHNEPLPIGSHAFAYPHGAGFALAGVDPEFFLRAAYLELFFALANPRVDQVLSGPLAFAKVS